MLTEEKDFERKKQEHPTEALKEGQQITETVYLLGKEETDVQKRISVEKMEFDDCQAPWEEDRNNKLSRKQHRPRRTEAEASQENMAHSYSLICFNCRHAQLQQGKQYPPRDTQSEHQQQAII